MRKVFILISIFFIFCNKGNSQNSEFSFFTMHTLVLQTSINNAQKILNERGFIFNGSTESKDTSNPKGKVYTRCSFIQKSNIQKNIADEIVLWRQKDSTDSMFEMFEYNTYNETIYSNLKYSCETSKDTKKLNERIEKDCIYIDYAEDGFLLSFQNCLRKNNMVYKATILNLLIFHSN